MHDSILHGIIITSVWCYSVIQTPLCRFMQGSIVHVLYIVRKWTSRIVLMSNTDRNFALQVHEGQHRVYLQPHLGQPPQHLRRRERRVEVLPLLRPGRPRGGLPWKLALATCGFMSFSCWATSNRASSMKHVTIKSCNQYYVFLYEFFDSVFALFHSSCVMGKKFLWGDRSPVTPAP